MNIVRQLLIFLCPALRSTSLFTSPAITGTAFTGNYFSHATVTGAGLTTLIVGTGSDAGKVALAGSRA